MPLCSLSLRQLREIDECPQQRELRERNEERARRMRDEMGAVHVLHPQAIPREYVRSWRDSQKGSKPA